MSAVRHPIAPAPVMWESDIRSFEKEICSAERSSTPGLSSLSHSDVDTSSDRSSPRSHCWVTRHDPYGPVSFGCHGHRMLELQEAGHCCWINFDDDFVKQIEAEYILAGSPPQKIGMFLGQVPSNRALPAHRRETISRRALALLAYVADVRLYDVDCMSRAGRWSECWVEGEMNAHKLIQESQKSVLADVGGAWVATSPHGREVFDTYRTQAPTVEGVPHSTMTVEKKHKRRAKKSC